MIIVIPFLLASEYLLNEWCHFHLDGAVNTNNFTTRHCMDWFYCQFHNWSVLFWKTVWRRTDLIFNNCRLLRILMLLRWKFSWHVTKIIATRCSTSWHFTLKDIYTQQNPLHMHTSAKSLFYIYIYFFWDRQHIDRHFSISDMPSWKGTTYVALELLQKQLIFK